VVAFLSRGLSYMCHVTASELERAFEAFIYVCHGRDLCRPLGARTRAESVYDGLWLCGVVVCGNKRQTSVLLRIFHFLHRDHRSSPWPRSYTFDAGQQSLAHRSSEQDIL
jgi:hypothetical protein